MISPKILYYENSLFNVSKVISLSSSNYKEIADIYVVEGAGGWQTPINNKETMADLVVKLNIPLIFVVGMKLGCLNHAILTYQSILSYGINPYCCIANILEPKMYKAKANIATLKQYIKCPVLTLKDIYRFCIS
jgi:dethiobiotin synthetase